MVKRMKNIGYHKSFNFNNENKDDILKYGLLNNFGIRLDAYINEEYNEDNIIKKR